MIFIPRNLFHEVKHQKRRKFDNDKQALASPYTVEDQVWNNLRQS